MTCLFSCLNWNYVCNHYSSDNCWIEIKRKNSTDGLHLPNMNEAQNNQHIGYIYRIWIKHKNSTDSFLPNTNEAHNAMSISARWHLPIMCYVEIDIKSHRSSSQKITRIIILEIRLFYLNFYLHNTQLSKWIHLIIYLSKYEQVLDSK